MVLDGVSSGFGEQFGLEIGQPQVRAKAVAGDRFDSAVFAVDIGVMNRAIDEIV